MNETARKYVAMFRHVKIASAATVDEDGIPQSRIINVMLTEDDGMYIVTSKGKPFYKQLTETGRISLSAMCPDCQSLKFTGRCRIADKKWVDKVFEENPGMNEVYPGDTFWMPFISMKATGNGLTCFITRSAGNSLPTGETREKRPVLKLQITALAAVPVSRHVHKSV